jgi:RNA polymerase sigma-70 factor (ECF subfamily)
MAHDDAQTADLYRRFSPALYRRALALLGDPQEALDVAQETFLDFLDARSRMRGDASAFTFLYQMATYKAFDRLRRRARWSGLLAETSYEEGEQDPVERAADDAEPHGRRVEAACDLALLTQGEKPEVLTAALLYFVEGYTTDEVAQTLELSRKTVGKHLARFAERARKRAARMKAGER